VSLLDNGPHTVTVYLEEEYEDSRGNLLRRPSAVGVTAAGVLMMPVSASRGAIPAIDLTQGQRVDASWRLIARSAPVGWWSRVEWASSGGAPVPLLRLVVLGGPLIRAASAATTHVTVTMREER
jgi:hypothetical protein